MRQLLDHIKKSIYGPAYYESLLSRPFSFSWKYYSALALAIAIFLTVVSSVPLVPKVNQVVRDFPGKFFAYYPDDLEVKIDKGIASSNVPEPYFLPVPKEFADASTEGWSLLVIDTKTPFSVEQLKAYKAMMWLGRDQFSLYDTDRLRTEPLNGKMSVTINEGVLRTVEQRLHPVYKFAAPAVVIAMFLGLLIGLGVNFLYLILGAVLIFLLGRLLKQRWSYGTSYRIGLHAITLPVLFDTLSSLLDFPMPHLQFLFSAIMFAVVYVNFKDAAPAASLTPTTPSEPPSVQATSAPTLPLVP